MASNMFLYWGSGSVPCWKAMVVLEEKGFSGYPNKLISFEKKEHKGEEVTKLNPRGQVPTFKDGDIVINESGAICDYLEAKYASQGNRLMPEDFALRAKVLQRMYESMNLSKAVLEGVVGYQFMTKPEDQDKELLDKKKKAAKEELQKWDEYLKQEGPDSFVVGKSFTMADVYIFTMLAFGVRSKMNLDLFPNLKSYYDKVVNRPSIQASWPPHWRESEGKDFFQGM